jgi:two-component system phosphate regulon sensor histidine kinase PhoR
MLNSILRKLVTASLAMALPPCLVLMAYGGPHRVWVAAATAVPGLVAVVGLAVSFSRSIGRMTAFVRTILDSNSARADLPRTDDEVGGLAAALSEMVPKIDDLVNRLRNELTRREAVLASLDEGVVAVDARLNVTFCNHAFQRAVGEPDIVEGRPLIKAVREPELFHMLHEAIESGETVRGRLRFSVQDSRSFDVSAGPLANLRSRGAIAILRDMTQGERVERMRRDFIANVSHEFRTPLATIRGYAETLLEGGLDDQENRRKFVEIILANGIRLNNIAADLLTLAELEEGPPRTEAGPILIEDVIGGAVRAVETAAKLAGVRIEREECPMAFVWGYRIRFEQALVNLLDNAVKFNQPEGRVRVDVTAPSPSEVAISISDTGIGIPKQDLNRIFERFYRVDKARSRRMGGTGLGLSIVKHAVQQMHGTITVESELGHGSLFRLTLPTCPPPAAVS